MKHLLNRDITELQRLSIPRKFLWRSFKWLDWPV